MREKHHITFASPDGHDLKLNLYLPDSVDAANPPALVVCIHGGSWRKGSYARCNKAWLTDHNFAVASISYRYSTIAKFPAQLHDCKAAIRFLHDHRQEHGYDMDRLALLGGSAGGHLSLLVALTPGQSWATSDQRDVAEPIPVRAVVDQSGPTDFILRAKTQPSYTEEPGGRVYDLLGHNVMDHQEAAKQASPMFHLSPQAPPVLIIQGTADEKVLPDQSIRFHEACQSHGVDSHLHMIEGAGHGGPEYDMPDVRDLLTTFLNRYLKPR